MMLTFEEFFQKKKIDLAALQAGQPALYGEFLKHYAAMGEKSFDHSKKFWFNKLRKEYLLDAGKPAVVPEKPLPVSDESLIPESPVMPADATGTDQVFKTISAKPAGFKPRFKAGAVKGDHAAKTVPTEDAKTEDARPIPSSDDELSGSTTESPVPSAETTREENAPSAAVNKPAGFKPRFKPGVTKAKAADTSPTDESTALTSGEPADPIPPEEKAPSSAPNKPAGFKPRFKPGVTKAKAATDPSASEKPIPAQATESAVAPASDQPTADEPAAPTEDKPTNSIPQEEETSSATASPESTKEETPSTSPNKPTGFKPRFKAGVTKPSKPKDDQ